MIVPQFWAEARLQDKTRERQVTVRRYGWSDASQEDARAMAEERAAEALRKILSGEKIERREPKVPYNGADGMPIREEIISRHGDTIITRNSYGAKCLNTPDVLFADVDLPKEVSLRTGCLLFLSPMILAGIYGWQRASLGHWFAASFVAIWIGVFVFDFANKRVARHAGWHRKRAMARIQSFSQRHSDWHLRVYETPAGFRVLAMHDTFDPAGEKAAGCFRELGTDRVYARMCVNQRCFRARVSPKPWRIGISRHLKPRTGVWPITPEKLPLREAWVRDYEQRSTGYAACRLVTRLGSERIHPAAEEVAKLHDELSKTTSGLPIA